MPKKRLTVNEVAAHCGVTFIAVRQWIRSGELPASQIPGRPDYQVELDDFIAFLHAKNKPVPKELLVTGQRVLIVEDDEPMVRLLESHLKKAGFETFAARDGFIAGAMLESVHPTLLTLDILMPGLDGIGVLRFIRGRDHLKDTRILVVSALPQAKLDEALQAGADDTLRKPFEPEVLIGKLYALAGIPPA